MKKNLFNFVAVIWACVGWACACGAVEFEKDSIEYLLSMTFSEVCSTNANEIRLRVMDRLSGLLVNGPDSLEGLSRRVHKGEVFSLRLGGRLRFGVPDSVSNLEVVATNDVGRLVGDGGQKMFGKVSGPFLAINRHTHAEDRAGSVENNRSFVIDFKSGVFYDVENKSFGRVKLPFRSLWKDWDDYMENFSGVPKVDMVSTSRGYAERVRNALATGDAFLGRTFRDYCKKTITNEMTKVVRYRPRVPSQGISEFYLACVRVRSGTVDVLGLASFYPESTGSADMMYMFDRDGSLHWICCFWKTASGRSKVVQQGSIYELGKNGTVRRFVELDGEGRELPRYRRSLKNMAMVAPEDRAAFFEEMYEATRLLTEAMEKHSYITAPDLIPPRQQPDAEVAARRDEQRRKELQLLVEANRKRLNAGLPTMTKTEERMFLHNEAMKKNLNWFERMRHETTGRSETTELDAKIDLERARLQYLYNMVRFIYPVAIRQPGASPKTLHEVVVCKEPGSGRPLLPGGEDDIKDQWGHEYRYQVGQGMKIKMAQEHPIITSAGPDGVFDTEDDLSSEDWFVFRKFENERRKAKPDATSR